nr:eRF1 domain 1 [uncultured bacterium]
MKLLSLDPKRTQAVVQPQSTQDLWRLSTLLEAGDVVTGKTERKIKVNEDTVARKPIVLSVTVTKTELQGDMLRVSGTTVEGMDDIPKGSHHTINVSVHDQITIDKEWLGWQLEKLQEEDTHPILILLMDREEALFAVLRREPEILATIKGTVQKKGIDGGSPYWQELATELGHYDDRIRPLHIIVASPAFFKEYVINLLPDHLKKKTVGATISATGEAALSELIRRPEVKQVLSQERYSQETTLVDALMEAIHKEKAGWGIAEVAELVPIGALQTLLVTVNFLNGARNDGTYDEVSALMKTAESTKAAVHVLDTSAADQVDKLGGIAGVKRW